MRPRDLQHACGWYIANSFFRKVWHLNITKNEDRASLVEFMTAYRGHYQSVLTSWSLQQQLYKSLIFCLRNRLNSPVFLMAMLVFCPKVVIDQIPMVAERRQDFGMGSGLYLSHEECWEVLQVLSEYQKQQSQNMNLLKEVGTKSFTLPTTCLVLEGIYFSDPDFLECILQKMPNLRHISLQHNGTKEVMKTLSKHCKLLESLCFLEQSIEASIIEEEIFSIFFGIPQPKRYETCTNLFTRFISDVQFREIFEFQFPNLRKLDIDELFFDEQLMLQNIYLITLLLQPKLTCFGKHTGLTRRMVALYKHVWSSMYNRPKSEATLQLTEVKFVDAVSVLGSDDVELDYWEEVAPVFENLISVEIQKNLWSENDLAKFCRLFNKQVTIFSLSELPLSDMSCLSNVTHLRLTQRRHYSFDKMHLILDTCPSLKTLSIHPTFFHKEARRNNRVPEQPNIFNQIMENEDLDVFERLLFAEVMGEAVNLEAMVMNLEGVGLNPNEDQFLQAAAGVPPPDIGQEDLPDIRLPPSFRSSKMSRKREVKHHNLTTLRIASLCEAGRKQSEDFLRGLLQRLPNLRHLCLGMWMGALNQRLTCTANSLVTVVTEETLEEPLLPLLMQLCCLPSGTDKQICQSLAALVKKLPSLHTLVLPVLDNCMLAPTLRYFQHSSLDIQYKCATDQVFSYWEPEH